MIKQGDKILVRRLESTVRQRTKDDPQGSKLSMWIRSTPKAVEYKATIGYLGRLSIPVRVAGGKTKKMPYDKLTITKTGVSFISHRPDWKGIKKGKEVLIPGKPITVKGKAVLNGLHIPVVINGESKIYQCPYEQIKSKKDNPYPYKKETK